MTAHDDILVVDNASNDPGVTRRIQASQIPNLEFGSSFLNSANDISKNSKVGGLYDAYNEVMTYALDRAMRPRRYIAA